MRKTRFSSAAIAVLLVTGTGLAAGESGAAAFPTPAGVRIVEAVPVPRVQRAVGTVQPRVESRVMAQASGRLLTVSVSAGDAVERGQVVATIDDRELGLRISQARRGVEAAEAALRQAEQGRTAARAALTEARAGRDRVQRFLASKAATEQQMEKAESAFRQAEARVAQATSQMEQARAGVERAREGVAEIQVLLDHTQVTAPIAGVVAERSVDPGELAWPGRPLLRIQDPSVLRLEAHVREGLTGQVIVGQDLEVWIDSLSQRLTGKVDEVVPLADPVSRKFTVKVRLPAEPRLLPGMFGRVSIPVGSVPTLLIPRSSVTSVGQLDMVQIRRGDRWVRRLVRLGEPYGEDVEVLSGLAPGEGLGVGRR